jgi:hypothetical protein
LAWPCTALSCHGGRRRLESDGRSRFEIRRFLHRVVRSFR